MGYNVVKYIMFTTYNISEAKKIDKQPKNRNGAKGTDLSCFFEKKIYASAYIRENIQANAKIKIFRSHPDHVPMAETSLMSPAPICFILDFKIKRGREGIITPSIADFSELKKTLFINPSEKIMMIRMLGMIFFLISYMLQISIKRQKADKKKIFIFSSSCRGYS